MLVQIKRVVPNHSIYGNERESYVNGCCYAPNVCQNAVISIQVWRNNTTISMRAAGIPFTGLFRLARVADPVAQRPATAQAWRQCCLHIHDHLHASD